MPQLSFTPPLFKSSGLVSKLDGDNGEEFDFVFERIVNNVAQPLPDELALFSKENNILGFFTQSEKYLGLSTIRVTWKLKDYVQGFKFSTEFSLLVLPIPKIDFTGASRPFFDMTNKPSLYELIVGTGWTFDFPPAISPTGTETLYDSVELKEGDRIMKYSMSNKQITIDPGVTKESHIGTYNIDMRLIDMTGIYSNWLKITVKIIEDPAITQARADAAKANSTDPTK